MNPRAGRRFFLVRTQSHERLSLDEPQKCRLRSRMLRKLLPGCEAEENRFNVLILIDRATKNAIGAAGLPGRGRGNRRNQRS
jgi:hypothetical protein